MLTPVAKLDRPLPACLTRDNLTSPYFPNTSQAMLLTIAVLCGIFMLTSFNRLHHTDLWGHLCYGRWIAEHGNLPTSDPFGAVVNEQPFVNTAWLAQWIGYETHRLGGEEGLVLGHAALATLGCGLLIAAVYARGVSLGWSALGGAVVYILALPITGTIRPQLFGMVGFPCVLLACSLLPTKRHPLFWLPFVMLLWANLHGSFLMGLLVTGLFAISTTIDRLLLKADNNSQLGRAWFLFGLCLVAVCGNPLGANLLPIVAGFGRHEVLASISEWAALSTEKKFTLTLFIVSAIMGLWAMIATPRRRTLFECMLLALFAIATISAIRMLAWWAFVWSWVVVPHFAAMVQQWRTKTESDETTDSPTAMQTLIGIGLVFTSLLVAPCSHSLISGKLRGLSQVMGQGTPIYVADEMARREITGNFFAPMDWADYIVWATHNRLHPLVYTHVHLVSPTLWNDYQRLSAGDKAWETLARKHNLRYLLADRDPKRKSELHRLLWQASRQEKPTTRILYQDQKCILVELLSVRE